MLDFRVLGPIELYDGETRVEVVGQRQLALLTYLFLHPGQFVATERLSAELWPSEDGTVKRLQVTVARLRRSLEAAPGTAEILRTVPGGYRLDVPPGCMDADRFRDACTEARGSLSHGDPELAVASLDAALSLVRGSPLADLQDEEFAAHEIARLDEERLERARAALRLPAAARAPPRRRARARAAVRPASRPRRADRGADARALPLSPPDRGARRLSAGPPQPRRALRARSRATRCGACSSSILEQAPDLAPPPPPRPARRREIKRQVPVQGQFVGRREDSHVLLGPPGRGAGGRAADRRRQR